MILRAFALALGQLGDRRLRRALWRGVGLALVLLAALAAALLWLLAWALPETAVLPLLGDVAWLDEALGWAALPAVLLMSVVLMTPVAIAMTSLCLDEVAAAVEAHHHPGLRPARPLPLGRQAAEALRALGVAMVAFALGIGLWLVLPPLAPLGWLALNGWLLAREYFLVAALRREVPEAARDLLRRHRLRLWLAGALMALPLAVPIVNLLVPVLGAATFTHLYHRLARG